MSEPAYTWPPGSTRVEDYYRSRGLHSPRRIGKVPHPPQAPSLAAQVSWLELAAWVALWRYLQ